MSSFPRFIAQAVLLWVFASNLLQAQHQQAQPKESLVLSSSVHAPVPFLAHTGGGAFDNYLTMNLPYAPAEALWKALEQRLAKPLKNRGEAHITLITPPEYTSILSKVLSMQDINDIASRMNIQSARFTPVCVGRAEAVLEGKPEEAYYVVVRSEDLIAIRRAVFEKYVAKGGAPSLWDPLHCYLHITLGFTKQDLHEEVHGVRKGANSCFLDVVEK